MVRHQKNFSHKHKAFIYILCTVAAIIAAIAAVFIVLHFLGKNFYDSQSYLSSDTSLPSNLDYDLVEIIGVDEPDAPELDIKDDGDTVVITVTEIIDMVDKVEQTKENTVIVKPSTIDASALNKKQVKLDVNCVLQNPELPTGCEITSLTTVLNYYGYNVSKTTMSDNYLVKSIDKVADFWKVFLGNPRSNGFGCYAQPIVDAANKYLKEQDNKYKAVNYSGTKFEKLLKEVENGNPVIIWSTMYGEKENDLREPYTTYKWEIDGKTIQWIAPEHCMVLIGYDIDRNVAIMSDPQRGIVEYNLETVKARYAAMHSQCVILCENDLPPVINGITDGETYYTTQYITVTDDNLKSVTVNFEHSDTEFFINGNTEGSYEIIATDIAGNKTVVTIYTKPITTLIEPIADLTEMNVSADYSETIDNIKNIAAINTAYATLEESEALNQIITYCDALLAKIENVTKEYNRIITAVGDYDTKIPTEEDNKIITDLITDIDTLASCNNLTEEQQTILKDVKIKCDKLLLLIPKSE